MSESDKSGTDPEPRQDEQRERPPIDKIKADNEKIPEKAKFEQEKFKPEGEKFGKGEIEKIKADNEKNFEKAKFEQEKMFEKVKSDQEKLPEKLKPEAEKLPKGEIEKVKPDKEKAELKEHKLEVKEQKLDFEKLSVPEKGIKEGEQLPSGPGPLPIDRETLVRHAEALESMGRELRHFIEQSERPDLTRGALRNEPDQEGRTEDDV